MKNKNLIIGLTIVVFVLIAGGVYLSTRSKKAEPVAQQLPAEEQVLTIRPEEIGLTLSASKDNRKVIFEVVNTQELKSLDYELSYTSKGDIPRGVIGYIEVKQPGKKIMQEITLGTCSDVCHYDEDVSNVKLILKVTKTDGSASQVEKSLEL